MNDAAVTETTDNEGVPSKPSNGDTSVDIIENRSATNVDIVGSVTKEEQQQTTTTSGGMIGEADPNAPSAGSFFEKEIPVDSTAVVPAQTPGEPKIPVDSSAVDTAQTPEETKDALAPTTDVHKETSEAQAGDATVAMEDVKKDSRNEQDIPAKETKKRVRRVGRTPTRKIAKLEENMTPSIEVGVHDTDNSHIAGGMDAATPSIDFIPGTAGVITMGSPPIITVAPSSTNQGVLSKHDEKWNAMFQKLMDFKEQNKHTLVPQCYSDDPRLGRWVHYQRVEYWIFQQKGTAKITEERIARLNNIAFEWDPQKAQWEKMFAKLKEFKKEFSHCRVPKGYDKDWELANWVRNQRLEQANLSKEGKKSRMTPERYKLLDDLGFKWSSPTPARARRNRHAAKNDASNSEEQKIASDNEIASAVKSGKTVPVDNPTTAPTARDVEAVKAPISKETFAAPNNADAQAAKTPFSTGAFVAPSAVGAEHAKAPPATETLAAPNGVEVEAAKTPILVKLEAITADTGVGDNLPSVEAVTNNENQGFVQDAIEIKSPVEDPQKTGAQDAIKLATVTHV